MSFREINIAIRAENRASSILRSISTDVISLGVAFGALDSQTGRTIMQVFSIVRLMTTFKAILTTVTAAQTAHNASVSSTAGVQSTLAVSTTGAMTAQVAQNTATQTGIVSQTLHAIRLGISSTAHAVYSATCWAATTAANALNISTATFLALTGVGIAVIAAAAVAIWSFTSSMNAATASVQNFNNASVETPSRVRGIQRAGDSALYRQGVETIP